MIEKKIIINYRHKVLLNLLRVFGGYLHRRDFQKYLFLFTTEFEKKPSFEFVPYRYGCFSFQSYVDKQRLINIDMLVRDENWSLKDNSNLEKPHETFNRFYEKYHSLQGDNLINDVYRRYPYYAINSKIASNVMNADELLLIASARKRPDTPCLFTIGYEGSSFEGYLNRIIKNNIKMLVDVRKNPISRKYGFSKKNLSETLNNLGIKYVHIPNLGISSEKRQSLNTQKDYDLLFVSYLNNELKNNKSSLDYLFEIFKEYHRIAITCFEADKCMCHRGIIANTLSNFPDWKYEICHI